LKVPQGARLLALLVEDNLINQKVASRLLEKHGCCGQTTANGREAVSLYTEYPIRSLEKKTASAPRLSL
jgi:CheY-like chemotaxis protein